MPTGAAFDRQPPQMVGVLMVPAEAIPAFAVPAVAPGMCFPGCVPVPMDRFTRWPYVVPPQAQQPHFVPDAGPCGPGASEKRAQVLQRAFSVASSIYRIRWTVDARKLISTDREAVSPSFELSFFAGPVVFKMILRPRQISSERGGACFRGSRGKGTVELRCMAESDTAEKLAVTFRLGVGSSNNSNSSSNSNSMKLRGPVRHDFSEKQTSGLPPGQAEWDFRRAVDEDTQTFVVCLEILSGAAN
ncbi:unnamed protein product [Polarella glacialis]|uniref:Uncharacterized protein n=1 Tax=Polarella glacialis TaxID=89957 RepID=A0A813KQH2_POLGL|nr:unnamed protein product [Polarella glacialis]